MSWRTVLISGRAKLDLKLNNMIIRKEEVNSIHIPEITILIIDSTTVSITTALIEKLVENKTKIIFTGKDHNPIGEVVNYYNKHNNVLMIKKQIKWSDKIKSLVWQRIIKQKIYFQSELVKYIDESRYNLLRKYISEVTPGDITNREGHAAKVYFNAIFGNDFSRDKESSINSMLDYGYSIILSIFNREIVSLGYLTQLGIFHDNQFNYFNLASDLMEPYRILVDEKVLDEMPKEFGKSQKYKLLEIFNKEVIIDNKKCTLLNSVSLYCRSIFLALDNNDIELMKDIRYEL